VLLAAGTSARPGRADASAVRLAVSGSVRLVQGGHVGLPPSLPPSVRPAGPATARQPCGGGR
jgi:hypothetical protein